MTGAFSRSKGARGELELCRLLADNLGGKYSRNLKQYQQSQEGDISQLVAGMLIECKNCKIIAVPQWWRQTVQAAIKADAIPCLAYKVARKGWKFITPSRDAMKVKESWSYDLAFTQELYEPGFFLMVRELGG